MFTFYQYQYIEYAYLQKAVIFSRNTAMFTLEMQVETLVKSQSSQDTMPEKTIGISEQSNQP